MKKFQPGELIRKFQEGKKKYEAAHKKSELSPASSVHGKNWIQGAIKNPGALHRTLGVKAGSKIPAKTLAKAAKKGGVTGKRARLAETLKGFHHKKHEKHLKHMKMCKEHGVAHTHEHHAKFHKGEAKPMHLKHVKEHSAEAIKGMRDFVDEEAKEKTHKKHRKHMKHEKKCKVCGK